MRSLLLATILLSSAQLLADEECLFDQDARRAENVSLQSKYPGSRLAEDQYTLIIPRDDSELTVNVGGCVHWGVAVNLQTSRTEMFSTDEAFLAEITSLVNEFAHELVNLDELNRIIEFEMWADLSDDDTTHYFLAYEGMSAFEVYRINSDSETRIGFHFYR